MEFNKLNLVLGSQSPRRKELLEKMGLQFEIKVTHVEETFDSAMDPSKVAEYLAKKKAKALLNLLRKEQIGITADSIVVLDQKIYEKPKDREDAYYILSQLSGRTHVVYTGVTIISHFNQISFTDATHVHLLPMEDDEIYYYIDNYKPFDKAGSYGIQDWIGVCKVDRIEGSYSTVMGLPIHRLYEALMKF